MIEYDSLMMFLVASTLLALAPGPDILFVLAQGISKGSRAGFMVTLGLCFGLIFHTTAVAMGIAVIFKTSEIAFMLLKWAGAFYLLYLAYLCFQDSSKSKIQTQMPQLSSLALFRRGVIMNVTNPKVSIFFLAFLPQFAKPENGSVTAQIFILGALFMMCAFVVFSGVAFMSGKIGEWFNKTTNGEVILNRISGTIFAMLALKLAFVTQ